MRDVAASCASSRKDTIRVTPYSGDANGGDAAAAAGAPPAGVVVAEAAPLTALAVVAATEVPAAAPLAGTLQEEPLPP